VLGKKGSLELSEKRRPLGVLGGGVKAASNRDAYDQRRGGSLYDV